MQIQIQSCTFPGIPRSGQAVIGLSRLIAKFKGHKNKKSKNVNTNTRGACRPKFPTFFGTIPLFTQTIYIPF